MLVRITEMCRMGCSHCIADARPDGAHMDYETFAASVNLTKSLSLPILLVSGGEPADHPEVVSYLRLAQSAGLHVSLLSNGMFLHEDSTKRDRILALVDVVQVTNDPRYYPKHVADFDHPKVLFERKLRVLSPMGRAKGNENCDRQSPICFNLRSTVRSVGHLGLALAMQAQRGSFCTPSVNIDGNIVCGETPSCASVGNVRTSSLETITQRIATLRCSRCGLLDNLDIRHRNAIGE